MNKILIVFLFFITGCTVTAPLIPVTYDSDVEVTTEQTATIELETGLVTGSASMSIISIGNNTFVPVSSGPVAALHFGVEDQLTFLSSLSTELTRLGILNVIETGTEITTEADQKVNITFVKTHHHPSTQAYTLDVKLTISDERGFLTTTHHIVSHTSLKERMFTNASQGKEKAAKKLMKALVDSIQKYLATHPAEVAERQSAVTISTQ